MAKTRQASHASPAYVVDGARTPFLKARGRPGPFSASDLAVAAGRSLLARQPISPEQLDEVILGCAMPSPDEANIGRVLALRLGCGHRVPGFTVMRNCASAMQALDSAVRNIWLGKSDLVLAGGTEAMSRAPILSGTDGFVLSRQTDKYVTRGDSIAKIVGTEVLAARKGAYLLED